MKYENPYIVLSTGTRFYAHAGVVGVGEGGKGTITTGYDDDTYDRDDSGDVEFTAEERREIADEMIRRWEAWATKEAK